VLRGPFCCSEYSQREEELYALPRINKFLKNLSKRRHASVSSVLDEMILNVRRAQERHTLGQAVEAYYSELPDHEARELGEWGSFAMSQFPAGDRK
jgi:hypothetical protein